MFATASQTAGLQGTQLQDINDRLETATPQEILRWAIETYPGALTMATAFGAEGCCLIAMLAQLRKETGQFPDIFNLDTGYQFPETLALRERLQQRYGLAIRLVSASETTSQMEARYGGPLYTSRPDHCCALRKVAPLHSAVQGFAAWITAIRRDQTPERSQVPLVGPDPRYPHLVKINPLANWTAAQVWTYIAEHHVPVNPLHMQGYPSIGCWPCTRPVAPGEDDRSGRWSGLDKRECGLHVSALPV